MNAMKEELGGNMEVFLVRWPNGDISLVKAESEEEALIALDEIDDANGLPIKKLDDCMIHLRLDDSGRLQFEDFGDNTYIEVMQFAYPLLWEPEHGSPYSPELVAAERERVKQNATHPHPLYLALDQTKGKKN